MGKGTHSDPPCLRKYGLPFYTISWVPSNKIFAQKLKQKQEPQETRKEGEGEELTTDNESTSPLDTTANRSYLAIAGGGGDGRNGIPNAIQLAELDFISNSLSEQPLTHLREYCLKLEHVTFGNRALASASMDSSARVTVIGEQKGESGGSMWIIVFVVLFAILVYFLKTNGAPPQL